MEEARAQLTSCTIKQSGERRTVLPTPRETDLPGPTNSEIRKSSWLRQATSFFFFFFFFFLKQL